MQYIPAQIPDELAHTQTGLLWAAANLIGSYEAGPDAIADAAAESGAPAIARENAEKAAVRIAASRCPTAADPLAPRHRWASWQQGLDDPWPILADAAGQATAADDHTLGLTPGRWEI